MPACPADNSEQLRYEVCLGHLELMPIVSNNCHGVAITAVTTGFGVLWAKPQSLLCLRSDSH